MGLFDFGGADHSENIVIDVSPLARKVDQVTSSVDKTTGAVVAMKAAVIAQEKQSTKQICENVNYGFYSLITSQISQKLAIHENAANSKLALMQSISKKIHEILLTAQVDYQRISRRYIDTFRTLDKNLKNRITELNKPAVNLSEKKKSLIFKSTTKNVASAICYAKESLPASQMFINAELKKHANMALDSLSGTMEEEKDYETKMQPIMCDGTLETPAMEYVPVVVSEAESLHQQDSNVWNVTLPDDNRLKERGLITTTCLESARNASWNSTSEEKRSALFEAMTALPEFSALNPRIAEEVKKMFSASDLQSWVAGGDA